MKLNDVQMIRLGQGLIGAGVLIMLLPLGAGASLAGLIIIGLGCAPIYPCIIHSTPDRFGADRSQAIIGVQMASAYVGTCLMPPLFGLIANHVSVSLFPVYMLVILVLMTVMHELLTKRPCPGKVLRTKPAVRFHDIRIAHMRYSIKTDKGNRGGTAPYFLPVFSFLKIHRNLCR